MSRNTMEYMEYILTTLFWYVIGCIWYRNLLFTSLRGFSKTESYIVAASLLVGGFLINFVITRKYDRTFLSIISTFFVGLGIYTYIVYAEYLTFFVYVAIGAGVVSLIYLLVLFCRKVKKTKDKKKIWGARIRCGYLGMRNIVACAGLLLMVSVVVKTIFFGGLITTHQVKGTSVYGEECLLANNIGDFLKLQPEEWDKLDLKERVKICQVLANCEGRYLGLNKKVTVTSSKTEPRVLGFYNDENHRITISVDHLKNSPVREVVETVCHEIHHAAVHQYKEVYDGLAPEDKNLIFLMDAAEYAWEIDNYTSGTSGNLEGYYSQKLEQMARSYSVTSAQQIYDRIDEYLEEQKAEYLELEAMVE